MSRTDKTRLTVPVDVSGLTLRDSDTAKEEQVKNPCNARKSWVLMSSSLRKNK